MGIRLSGREYGEVLLWRRCKPCSAIMPGTRPTRGTRRTRLARKSRTPGDSATCTATFGSGAGTGMMRATTWSRQEMIRRGHRLDSFYVSRGGGLINPRGAVPVRGPQLRQGRVPRRRSGFACRPGSGGHGGRAGEAEPRRDCLPGFAWRHRPTSCRRPRQSPSPKSPRVFLPPAVLSVPMANGIYRPAVLPRRSPPSTPPRHRSIRQAGPGIWACRSRLPMASA